MHVAGAARHLKALEAHRHCFRAQGQPKAKTLRVTLHGVVFAKNRSSAPILSRAAKEKGLKRSFCPLGGVSRAENTCLVIRDPARY